ncbi:MAG TPA: hypothetical protein PLE05_11055 [Bacillota bacterium]|nr:hypothetical protein [Bacillota bacterium]HQJ37748.1 hypothetical protein [Bacillota bacterium]
MEKFWAVILIFVVVAAAGLMYVNQVYIPQKETQMAMADMANQTLTAVKLEIGDGTISREVEGSEIRGLIEGFLDGNSIDRITIGGTSFDDVDDISDITNLDDIEGASRYYMRVTSNNGEISALKFIEIL